MREGISMPQPRKSTASRKARARTQPGRILDLFAGAGGWDEGLRMLGLNALGIETDPWACRTAAAAGHPQLQADLAVLDPQEFAPTWGLIGSPPCQAHSTAGKGLGRADKALVIACAYELAAGHDSRASRLRECLDPRSLLTVEPLRYALALRPRWVALEQVPGVLELWTLFAAILTAQGYETAVGVLRAECFGVPQTRRRAFLIASLDAPVKLPEPTHRSYQARRKQTPPGERGLLPWVSMAQALDHTPGCVEPTSKGWLLRNRPRRPECLRDRCEPAPSIIARGHQSWVRERPATTVACDSRIFRPGSKRSARRPDAPGRSEDAVRITVSQAAVLQGFRTDYPWQGAQGRRFQQIGNAVPPPLALRVLEEATRPRGGS